MKAILIIITLLFAMNTEAKKIEVATLGAGCFWCVEAVYQQLEGVISVQSGYSGGHDKNPTYKQVCTGETGHAEVCQITFDANMISFGELLTVFWSIHDATSLNKQGGDVGTQYRSAVFYHSQEQKNTALEQIKTIDEKKLYDKPIVTEVVEFEEFYPAEDYHDNYFADNPNQPYCKMVVGPKVDKFKKAFKEQLKNN